MAVVSELGLGDILHDIVMCVLFPWLVVNHLHLLSDGRYDADMSVKLTFKSVKVNEIIKW